MFQRLEDGDLSPALSQEYLKMVGEELLMLQPSSLVHLIDTMEPQNDDDIRTVLRIKSAFMNMMDCEKPTINLHLTGLKVKVYYTDNRLIYVMKRDAPFVTNKKNVFLFFRFFCSVLHLYTQEHKKKKIFLFPFFFSHFFFPSKKKKRKEKKKCFFFFFFFLILFQPDILVEIDLPLSNRTSEVLIHAQSQRGDYPVGFIPKRPWQDMSHVLYECDMKSLVQNGNN